MTFLKVLFGSVKESQKVPQNINGYPIPGGFMDQYLYKAVGADYLVGSMYKCTVAVFYEILKRRLDHIP